MVRTALAVALSLIAAPLFAQSYTFSGIPWGSSRADVQKKFDSMKFDEVNASDEGITFQQKLTQIEVLGQAKFDDHGLNQIMVVYFPHENKALSLFDAVVKTLTKTHGEPIMMTREFEEPYAEGDGLEDTAIRTGKATLQAGWGTEDGEHVKMGAFPYQGRIAIITMYQAGAQE